MLTGRTFAANPYFTDIDGHWAETYINKWAEAGVVKGYDGKFNPDDNVTKAEFSSVLNQIFKYTKTVPNTFSDVKDTDWFAPIIQKVAAAGVITPDTHNMVYPTKPLTRGELFVMLAKAYDITPVVADTSFLDNTAIDPAQKSYVKALQDKGLIVGFAVANGYEIRTNTLLTRAEMLTVLDKATEGLTAVPTQAVPTQTPAPSANTWKSVLPPGNVSSSTPPAAGDGTVIPGAKPTETPVPNQTGTPAPNRTGTPAPNQTGTPAPNQTGTPAPQPPTNDVILSLLNDDGIMEFGLENADSTYTYKLCRQLNDGGFKEILTIDLTKPIILQRKDHTFDIIPNKNSRKPRVECQR